MPFETKDLVTISLATVGAVLGVVNTWTSLAKDKVRLRVTTKRADVDQFPGTRMGCIEVSNLSKFAVTIREIGFTFSGDPRKERRWAIGDPIVFDDRRFPRRLEPRESTSGYFRLQNLPEEVTRSYALTDCDHVSYGISDFKDKVTYVRTRRGEGAAHS